MATKLSIGLLKNLYVGMSDKQGKGIFASELIPKDTLFEVAPVILLPIELLQTSGYAHLRDHTYHWNRKEIAVALGYGTLYNHSYEPNALYEPRVLAKTIQFWSIRDIQPDEEICINYNLNPNDKSKLWFRVLD